MGVRINRLGAAVVPDIARIAEMMELRIHSRLNPQPRDIQLAFSTTEGLERVIKQWLSHSLAALATGPARVGLKSGQDARARCACGSPQTCLDANDKVEASPSGSGAVAIYKRAFVPDADAACQRDHRAGTRRALAWAVDPTGAPPQAQPSRPPARKPNPDSSHPRIADLALFGGQQFELMTRVIALAAAGVAFGDCAFAGDVIWGMRAAARLRLMPLARSRSPRQSCLGYRRWPHWDGVAPESRASTASTARRIQRGRCCP